MSHPTLDHLRRGGRRLTSQRRLIWQAVHESDRHLTAEEILDVVRRYQPGMTVATVYRNLQTLLEMDHIREVPVGHGPRRFEANCEGDQHVDLVCPQCETISDADLPEVRESAERALARRGVRGPVHVVIYAPCAKCSAAGA